MALLQKGTKAPDFKGLSQTCIEVSSEKFRGQKLILYFYPKDNTPGCTAEGCNLNDNYDYWLQQGYNVVGISPDSAESHRKFADKHGFKFTLIADPDHKIAEAYGAWGEKNNYGKKYMGVLRTTYIIDEHGIITDVFSKVDTKEHTAQIKKQINL
ncbi:MAG: thioredoxin-dependent thiol peroxidase [Bacteroidales bacterium]|jgi:peroxiredoxin Q/BCP|nr:thioredoxin-dependent thiol peroxidase [Bacteroidales bacterium]